MIKTDALKEIVQKKKERLALLKQLVSREALQERISQAQPVRSLRDAIVKPRTISLIAEVKKASPSAGVIREAFDPVAIATLYQEAAVQAISVLTEEDYFQGSLDYLSAIRAAVSVPLLRKDFIFEPYQVYESRACGADAVLLLAELLTRDELSACMQVAGELGMECLIEVHAEKELKKVLNLKGVTLIGINNRNLHTLEVDFKTTERLYPLVPKDKVVVVESGIKSRQDVMFLKILGVAAVLVGTAFMEAQDIRQKLEALMGW